MTRRSFEPSTRAALIAIALLAVGFVGLERVVSVEPPDVDRSILRALRGADGHPIGPEVMVETARDVTALGGVPVLVIVITLVAGQLALVRKFRTMFAMLAACGGGIAVSSGLKLLINRARPEEVEGLAKTFSSSFPSGHAMVSAVVYLTLGMLLARTTERPALQRYFVAVAALLAILIGCTRVYLGVHYPTDVLAGWMGGLAWSLAVWVTVRALQREGAVEEPDEPTDTVRP